jgi:hypothetical protein
LIREPYKPHALLSDRIGELDNAFLDNASGLARCDFFVFFLIC